MTKKEKRQHGRAYRRQGRINDRACLWKVSTCALVDELQKREGVDAVVIGPYIEHTAHVEGPAILLAVID
jgi:hypothetical protein